MRPASLRFLVGAALALVPLAACALAFRTAMRDSPLQQIRPLMMENWFTLLLSCTQDGSAEIVWFFALPLLAALLGGLRRGAYLVAFPVLLALTFANPLLFEPVAAHVTSYHTYFRLWWLFPVGPGLAVLLVLTVRLLTRLRGPRAGSVAFPLLATAVGLAATWLLPGVAVWGPRNNYIGRLGTPHLAENVAKMPADLAPVAAALAREPGLEEGRILCNEEVASFLTPYARAFRFVQTRPMYTPGAFAQVGRPAEGLERYALARALGSGEFPGRLDKVEETSLLALCGDGAVATVYGPFPDGESAPELCALLQRYRVRWAVTGPGDRGAGLLQANGFQAVLQEGRFTLWKAEGRRCKAKELLFGVKQSIAYPEGIVIHSRARAAHPGCGIQSLRGRQSLPSMEYQVG